MSNIIDKIQLSGVTYAIGGKAIEAGRGISVTTGATADTISVSLPISAGTGTDSIIENNNDNIASGQYSHAEGCYTIASGRHSHAEGFGTIATNESEHASGYFNVSNTGESISAQTLFSVGNGEFTARHNAFEIRQNGDIYISSGGTDIKLQDHLGGGGSGTVSTAITSGDTNAVAGGAVYDKFDEVEQVTAAALNDINDRVSEDEEVTAAALNTLNTNKQDKLSAGTGISISGNVISATGGGGGNPTVELTQAEYDALVTAGTVSADTYYIITDATPVDMSNYYTTAQTNTLLAGKQDTLSAGRGISISSNVVSFSLPISAGTGTNSVAEGYNTTASGQYSHAEGFATTANGYYTHAEGYNTTTTSYYSHAEGISAKANGIASHAEGYSTRTNNISEHASGQYNVSSNASTTFGNSGNTLFSVGNGTSDSARHNAFEIRQNGDIYISSGGTDIKLQDHLGGGGSGTVSSAITRGDTNAVAGGAVYDRFDEVEQVTAEALNELNDKVSEDEEVTAAALNVLNDRLSEDEEVTAAALNNLNEALSGKQDTLIAGENITISGNVISATGGGGGSSYSAGTGIDITNDVISVTGMVATSAVTSTVTSGDTNPVAGGALYDELRIENAPVETTLTFRQPRGENDYWTTNYPSGCTTLVGNILASSTQIELYNNSIDLGGFMINCYDGVLDSVTFWGIEGTYSISGSVVTISYPNVTNVTRFRIRDIDYQPDYQTYKAMATVAPTVLKNQVTANTATIEAKVDTTTFNSYASSVDSALSGKLNISDYVVDSALNVASTNPVQNQALYSELRLSDGGGETETTLTFESQYSTNYPNGCTKIKVEVVGSSNWSTIDFYNDDQPLGNITINNWGSISVDVGNFQGSTYEISGTTVIISYPTVTNVAKIRIANGNYVFKAVTTGAPTALKTQVAANTTALGGLSLVKLTQAQYDALATKDNSTLYVIVN